MHPLKIFKKHHKHINNPFPSQPKTLPFIHGSLSFNPGKVPQHYTFQVGDDFLVNWSSGNGGWLYISHLSQPKRSLWSTIPGEAFISAAAAQTEVEESRGSFAINDGDVSFVSNHQSIDEIRVLYQSDIEKKSKDPDFLHGFFKVNDSFKGIKFPVLIITGWVFSKRKKEKRIYSSFYSGTSKSFYFGSQSRKKPSCAARYWLFLNQKNKSQIGFKVKFGDLCQQWSPKGFPKSSKSFPKWKLVRYRRQKLIVNFSRRRGFLPLSSEEEEEQKVELFRGFNRVFITYSSESDERFYGFGEQFSHMEFKGKRVPILVQEQGIGRGDQPITFASNLVSYRSGGDWSTTYAPSPFYMTSKMRSLYLEGYCYSVFDLTKRDRVQIQIYEGSAEGRILNGTSPVALIESFTEIIGRPPVLPEWIVSGAVVGMQGGTEAVRRVWDQLQEHDVPISAFWLQDWVGQRETLIGSQLWWNWEVDKDRYPGWKQLVHDLRACDIQVMTYCNPCLVPTDQKMNRERDLFEEAKNLGILVKDNNGDTYMIPNTTFDVGMLDFTHPRTGDWFKKILHEMVDSGVRGWMADFGEGLPLDANTYSDAIAAHNRYPELWAKINREFVDEWKSNCHGNKKDDSNESLVFFMRAGFRGSFKWSMLFWEGDQMVSWQKNDGIKSSVIGLLSSGLSGFALNHSDIGGYCSVNMPFIRYHRSEELLMRWMELNAFSTVFRTHEGNIPSSNCQFYSNSNTLAQFARFAKVFKAWKFYRLKLVKEAAEKGLPVVRHLFLHYPNDEHVHSLSYQQFLVGSEFLVVPVLDRGKKEVKAYFPMSGGDLWQHVWTGRVYRKPLDYSEKNQQGFEAWVDAPIGYPAVFVKLGSSIGETFLRNLRDLNIY
ncbi:Alpha-glucosidase protein [Dioscorea alata]|uniref:Alpha-glucosidase protein n=1 Tax=Dioscorea alata TaxID=55571 RepID=A0ACB7VS76_DIOAL|nr:Alpha-glucosidase protein [Dioscorea alata]